MDYIVISAVEHQVARRNGWIGVGGMDRGLTGVTRDF